MRQTFMGKSYIYTILLCRIFHINLFNITKFETPCEHSHKGELDNPL